MKCKRMMNNEKGAQAIEWIALAGIIVLLFGALSQFFVDADLTKLGEKLIKKLRNFIGQI